MFGNCFFPLFSVFKNNFLFLRLKNLFGNSKWIENKNCFQNLGYVLVTVFVFYFQNLVFGNIKKKTIFLYF